MLKVNNKDTKGQISQISLYLKYCIMSENL